MGVVMDIADRIVVLDFGKKIAEGTPEEVKNNPQIISAYLGKEK
jgi:branched-chain amino acid transport system ATP-binding protein